MLLRKNKIINIKVDDKKIVNKINNEIISSNFKKTNSNNSLVVGEGVNIEGSIKSKDEVIIQGKVEADVDAKKIVIGKNGELQGNIKTIILEVEGKAKGEIEVENLIKIFSTGIIDGKLSYQKLEVKEGGQIKGDLSTKEFKQEEFSDWKPI